MRKKRSGNASLSREKQIAEAVASLSGFRPAHEVLVPVEAVKTIFPWVNRASKIGGWPTSRFSLAHGESGNGKTELGIGIGASFLAAGSIFGHMDAENTTPFSWSSQLIGPLARSSGYVAIRPATFEEARGETRRFCDTIAEHRTKGRLDPDVRGFLLVDSIRKLVPKNIWDELTKEAAGKMKRDRRGKVKERGIDGMGGRAAQIKAAYNAAWLDELIPLLAETKCSMLVIARETLDDHGRIKVGGGAALFYDSSLVVRVERDEMIADGSGADAVIFGERRRVIFRKTKVAGRELICDDAFYHSSTGALEGVPAGFDRPRDVLELGLNLGVVEVNGSWLNFEKERLGQGANNSVRLLHSNPSLVSKIEDAIAERDQPAETIAD